MLRLYKKLNKNFFNKRLITSLTLNNLEHNRYVNGEHIYMKKDFCKDKISSYLNNNTISVLGYGPQGRSQSLNMIDNNINVILGLRKDGNSYNKALEDGWIPNKNLFTIEEAVEKSNIVKYLLSDVGQIKTWDKIVPYLNENKTLYFSHGFGITYKHLTNINPPKNIDIIMVAPKGAGISVREKFLNNEGINCSYAIYQDYSGDAKKKCIALAYGFGCDIAYETTFEKETYSDLTGERCVLMGLIQGAFKAQYDLLIEKGHSPLEAYNETVEEALVSLYPLIADKGMDWLYSNCSTTAQIGALNWAPKFEKVLKPVIRQCYNDVTNDKEVNDVIKANSDSEYRKNLNKRVNEIANQDIWISARNVKALQNH